MPGPPTEALNEELKEIRDGFARISVGLAEVRDEVRVITGFAKVFGVLFLSGLVSGIWWAATLSGRVGNVESRLDKIEAGFDKVDARFDKIEASLARLLAKP